MDTLYDPLRKKEVAATPEEYVRQAAIEWLHREMGIPLHMMRSEVAFSSNGMNWRADIVVYGKDASAVMLVECKAPSVALTPDTIRQGIRYNRVLKVRYLWFTNGKSSYFCEREEDGSDRYRFLSEIKKIEL